VKRWRGMSEVNRILVIDDDASIRDVLTAVLEREGYLVDVAENGSEAIRKSKIRFYNLALIDIRLPDMEGTRLLTELKETIPKMIKIILTGYPSLQNAVEAVNKNADGYLVKPINMEDLLKTVKRLLEKQREERKFSEEKIVEFVESRAKELEDSA
jgi:DNA-binding NtrC family response regulator